jgi:DNA replication protein DnaC
VDPKPVALAIKQALEKLERRNIAPPRATDEEVAAKITALAAQGYRPSEQIVEAVRDYLTGYGVLLSGPAGVGKTMLMTCLYSRIRNVEEIVGYGLRQLGTWYEWTDGTDMTIDDLGAESTTAEYGAKDDLLKLVIAHRAERQNGRTCITTNLTAAEIAERYGDRTLSRILGMCKAHTFGGPSARRPVAGTTRTPTKGHPTP